jgi:hypothetical protein
MLWIIITLVVAILTLSGVAVWRVTTYGNNISNGESHTAGAIRLSDIVGVWLRTDAAATADTLPVRIYENGRVGVAGASDRTAPYYFAIDTDGTLKLYMPNGSRLSVAVVNGTLTVYRDVGTSHVLFTWRRVV